MKILLVEDRIGLPMVKVLEKWGHEATLVQSAEEALGLLTGSRLDLLITDYSLPRLSGLELVKKLRRMECYADLPVLMTFGAGHGADIAAAVQTGVQYRITKPFSLAQLKEVIEKIVAQAEGRSMLRRRVLDALKRSQALKPGVGDQSLMFLGEAHGTAAALLQPTAAATARYLGAMHEAVEAKNTAYPGLKLAYRIESNTQDIIKLLHSDPIVERLRLLVVSLDCMGNVPLLARSIGTNPRYTFPFLILCSSIDQVPDKLKSDLQSYGVELVERATATRQQWTAWIEDHVVRPAGYISKVKEGHYKAHI